MHIIVRLAIWLYATLMLALLVAGLCYVVGFDPSSFGSIFIGGVTIMWLSELIWMGLGIVGTKSGKSLPPCPFCGGPMKDLGDGTICCAKRAELLDKSGRK